VNVDRTAGRVTGESIPRARAGAQYLSWPHWQRNVLQLLRRELDEVVARLRSEQVDWQPWVLLYHQGWTPHAAVRWALDRDVWKTIATPSMESGALRQRAQIMVLPAA
jgi:hypothetical protein